MLPAPAIPAFWNTGGSAPISSMMAAAIIAVPEPMPSSVQAK
jgi:hypothetical protein